MKKFFAVILCLVMAIMMPAAALAEETAPAVTVDLTGVIVAAVVLVFDMILGWVAKAYLPSLKAWLDERTTGEQQKRIYELVEKLVLAAEQMIGAGMGTKKMKYVINELRRRGINVDVEMIEAAVKEMNDKALKIMGETLDVEDTMEVELGEGVEARQKDDGTMGIYRTEEDKQTESDA